MKDVTSRSSGEEGAIEERGRGRVPCFQAYQRLRTLTRRREVMMVMRVLVCVGRGGTTYVSRPDQIEEGKSQ